MRRTRKWAFVAQEATRLADLGLSPKEIAARLGLSKSTVTRWMASGKLNRTNGERPQREVPPTRPGQSPAEWAASVRKAYDLDSTDDQLVSLAEKQLVMASDAGISAQTRIAAAGRFQALVKQLALVTKAEESHQVTTPSPETVRPARVLPPRSNVDPRAILMAVK